MNTNLTETQKQNIRAWIADLREHPELQGKNVMQTEDGKFCCLGRAEHLRGRTTRNIPMPEFLLSRPDMSMILAFFEDYGISPGHYFCQIAGEDRLLAVHNDGNTNTSPKTFEQIADALERFLEGS